MAYSETSDLLLENIPVPATAQKYVDEAANEIDSYLGTLYVTPLSLDENNPQQRPGALLVKRISIWLSSGRLIMALGAPGEDDQIHQYAKYLVDEAISALKSIQNGSILLPGAPPVNPGERRPNAAMASFADEGSAVEGFNEVFGNPAESVIQGPRPWLPYYGSRQPLAPYTW